MSTSRLEKLLLKYLTSTLSDEEKNEFQSLISSVDQETLFNIYNKLNIVDPFLEDIDHNFDEAGVLYKIQKSVNVSKNSYKKYYHIALSIASLILLFILFKVFVPSKSGHWLNSQSLNASNEISLLDSTGVRLKLADGQIVNLKDTGFNKLLNNNLFSTVQQGSSAYYTLNNTHSSTNVLGSHIFFTERGAMSSIILEDGTTVWLNSASSLKFPSSFSGQDTRSVEITGEAYFDVAHDKDKPFIVKVGDSKITVLGTKFNIKAYEQNTSQTTLIQGSVQVGEGNFRRIIYPGDQAIVQEGRQIQVRQVNVEDYTQWKTGVIQFNGLNVEQIINELGRWYDIQDIENLSKNEETYTGSLNKNKDLSKMLSQLEFISNTVITIKGRRVIITDK